MFETLSARLTAALKKMTGRGVLRPEDVEAGLREVRLALLEADVNFKVVKEFVERVRARLVGAEVSPGLTAPQTVVKAVDAELVELLGGNSGGLRYSPAPPTVLMLVGLQGSGKTTTAVKLAVLARRERHRPMVVALDLRRPAAVEQLRILAERENVAFHSGKGDVTEIAAASLQEAARLGLDVVILDTAGRQHVDAELMEELKRLKSELPITETFLVADSMTGQDAVKLGEAFGQQVGLDGVILTKLDGDARGGAALSLRVATGQRIRFAGVGERPQDLEVFQADRTASRILGMGDVLTLIERAEQVVDKQAAVEIEKRMRAGQVSFDDFLTQIRQLRSMGCSTCCPAPERCAPRSTARRPSEKCGRWRRSSSR
jgi:signal recognition particle subunit SRP54